MRLIDADALNHVMQDVEKHFLEEGYVDGSLPLNICKIIVGDVINKSPTVDAAPVVHAKWVFDRPYHYKCSACNNMWSSVAMVMSYCPNCGAKMDGGAEG